MIDIQHPHSLGQAAVRSTVQMLADKLSERYDISSRWDGDSLLFSRTGVEGRIELADSFVRITAQLNFPFSMMQPMVESEIKRLLSERLP